MAAKPAEQGPDTTRETVLQAAFHVFVERGLTAATTYEIATRARVSKATLYGLYGSKQGLFAALIARRVARMSERLGAAETPRSADELREILARFGEDVLTRLADPATLAVYRLVLEDAGRTPELARVLDEAGRTGLLRILEPLLAEAHRRGFVGAADPAQPAQAFLSLLSGSLPYRLALRVADPPSPRQLRQRARWAATAVVRLFPAAGGGGGGRPRARPSRAPGGDGEANGLAPGPSTRGT